jgi:hypothetical protein
MNTIKEISKIALDAEKNFQFSNIRTLLEVENLDSMLTNKNSQEGLKIIARFKGLIERLSENYHTTLIMQTNKPLSDFEEASLATHRFGLQLELKEGINLTYLTIYEATKNKFEGSDELPKLFEASKRYKFTFNLNKEKTEFKIKLEINKNIERDYGEFKWIEECRSNEDIKNMLDNFLREIFDFSNFLKFNEFIILPIKIDEETGTIISSIKSIKGEPEPLRIKYDHNQKDD